MTDFSKFTYLISLYLFYLFNINVLGSEETELYGETCNPKRVSNKQILKIRDCFSHLYFNKPGFKVFQIEVQVNSGIQLRIKTLLLSM